MKSINSIFLNIIYLDLTNLLLNLNLQFFFRMKQLLKLIFVLINFYRQLNK
jgi:hypothetical protein